MNGLTNEALRETLDKLDELRQLAEMHITDKANWIFWPSEVEMKTYTWARKINPDLPDEDPLIIGLSAMRIPRDVIIAETIGEHAYGLSDVNTGLMLYIPKELFESLYTPVEE